MTAAVDAAGTAGAVDEVRRRGIEQRLRAVGDGAENVTLANAAVGDAPSEAIIVASTLVRSDRRTDRLLALAVLNALRLRSFSVRPACSVAAMVAMVAMSDEDEAVRAYAASVVAKLAEKVTPSERTELVEELCRLLTDSNGAVAERAAYSLIQLGEVGRVPTALRERSEWLE